MPLNSYSGGYKSGQSQYALKDFYDHVKNLDFDGLQFDEKLLDEDTNASINYISNIPVGYGLGSSGALTAAVFERYFIKNQSFTLDELQSVFSQIESFFHGSSSGLDPLVSFFNQALLVNSDGKIEFFDFEANPFQFYLVDTGMSRNTANFVKIFKSKLEDIAFANAVKRLGQLNNQAIEFLRSGNENLKEVFDEISKLQQDYFSEMIPEIIKPLMIKNHLKLCGAGGGGFFLGMCLKDEFDKMKGRKNFTPLF